MYWIKDILRSIETGSLQIINDSKTPSGEPHVGSLRGVLIHNAIFQILKRENIQARYNFGSDDYDPLDAIPKGYENLYEKYLGMPLCNVPAPPNSKYGDIAQHFSSSFLNIFKKLEIQAETYRMRDVYRKGKFNEAIDKILSNKDAIYKIYDQLGSVKKSSEWYPFQPICENCHKIGTTISTSYDGKEVTYNCQTDSVNWAKGCGYRGKISPFDGNGKLPWKMEWVAKWMTFGITIEGGGMDHNTKGGARDVTEAVFETVFKKKSPINIPYGFFLFDKAKMSSSKGIGASAKEIMDFLSPEIVRYLMLAIPPKRSINFSLKEKYIDKLHNDFDSVRESAFSKKVDEDNSLQKEIFFLSDSINKSYFLPSFSTIKVWVQLPHIDILKSTEQLSENILSDIEKTRLESRVQTAKYWLKYYAESSSKFELQQSILPSMYEKLESVHLDFLNQFSKDLSSTKWKSEFIKQQVFDSARSVSISPKIAFQAIYIVFLNKLKGPQVGNLLSCLKSEWCINRLTEIQINKPKYHVN